MFGLCFLITYICLTIKETKTIIMENGFEDGDSYSSEIVETETLYKYEVNHYGEILDEGYVEEEFLDDKIYEVEEEYVGQHVDIVFFHYLSGNECHRNNNC